LKHPELDGPLYHGTTVKFTDIDLSRAKPFKDFGLGFYTTTSKQQAEKFARLLMKRAQSNIGYIMTFEYAHEPSAIITRYEKPSEDWLAYVVGNRKYPDPHDASSADIIIGAVADDDVGVVVTNYLSGTYGEVGTARAKQIAIEFLLTTRYHNQVAFKSKAVCDRLILKEVRQIV